MKVAITTTAKVEARELVRRLLRVLNLPPVTDGQVTIDFYANDVAGVRSQFNARFEDEKTIAHGDRGAHTQPRT